MHIIVTTIVITLPAFGAAQLADDEFCSELSTFEHMMPAEFESLAIWGEEYIDAIFASVSEAARPSDAMPEGWLKNKVAMQIADCYVTGRETERDINKAMAVLEVPAQDDHSGSAHMLASMKVFQSDSPELQREGFSTLKQEADDGSAYSAGKIGWAYALGLGTERSEQRALDQYLIAATAGMTYWQFLLAHAYKQGYYGLAVDPEREAYWRKYEPKVHIAKYECEIAGYYERGIFPANEELHKQYRDACEN